MMNEADRMRATEARQQDRDEAAHRRAVEKEETDRLVEAGLARRIQTRRRY